MEALFLFFGGILIISVFLAIGTLLNGWALHLIWNWFIPSIFVGLPELSMGQAIAIAMVVSFLTYQYQPSSNDKEKDWSPISYIFVRPIFTVLFALILKAFVAFA